MLAFVEHVLSQDLKVPLLVVATTRPELLQHHRGVLTAATDDRLHRLMLPTLSQAEAAALLAALLDAELAADVGGRVLDLIGGNPLYAEQYVRLLHDRGLLMRSRDGLHLEASTGLPLPETVQAVLAARLDTLPPEHKGLLCDAAVIGETFWHGGVVALSGCDEHDVEEAMAALAARDLVRPVVKTSIAGEAEYLFWHATVRDVAYGQLPRRLRLKKHSAAASWLEEMAGERSEEFAEILAHHYVTALDLAGAVNAGASAQVLRESAVRYLRLAGDRATKVDPASAERHYAHALELVGETSPQAPILQCAWAQSLGALGRYNEALEPLRAAYDHYREGGDRAKAAFAAATLAGNLRRAGQPGPLEMEETAFGLIDGEEPTAEAVFVLGIWAGHQFMVTGRPEASIPTIDRAISIGRELGLPDAPNVLSMRGVMRCELGEVAGLDDLRAGVDAALAQDLGFEAVRAWLYYAAALACAQPPARVQELIDEALDFALRRRLSGRVLQCRALLVESLWLGGQWDDALGLVSEIEEEIVEKDPWNAASFRVAHVVLLAHRGQATQAEPLVAWISKTAASTELPELACCGDHAAAVVSYRAGDIQHALKRVLAWADVPNQTTDAMEAAFVPEAVRIALEGGDVALAKRILGVWHPILPLQQIAVAAATATITQHEEGPSAAVGEFSAVAARWRDFGVPYEEGQALLAQGRCLVALGRAPEAGAPLEAAREIFERLGAKPALAETDELMQQVASVWGRQSRLLRC